MNRTSRELSAESICGELGVMSFNASELPDHVSPDNIRLCAKHPHGRNRTLDPFKGASLPPAYASKHGPASNASMPLVHHLGERSCYFAAPYGCSRGGCWKVCDEETGKWCWAAENSGYGHWRYCTTYADCGTDKTDYGCGHLCGPQCGCGC
ncbi:hypothetical protein TrVFT333_003945 [Trichoderma virens FT-333]|nr:hypothetical protein TrVFT333_003945 [Trichoderma virens FT-333]